MNLDDEKARLLQRDAEWAAVAGQGRDVDRIVSFWTDDAIVLPPGLPAVAGTAALREYVQSSLQIPGFRITWTSTDVRFSPDGKLAYMFSRNAVTVSDADGNPAKTTGRAVTVWRRDAGGEWRCAVDIWNAGPAEATTKYKQLHEELRSLQVALRSSGKLSDSQKKNWKLTSTR